MWISSLFNKRRLILLLLLSCAVTGLGVPAVPPKKRPSSQNGGNRSLIPKKKACTESDHGRRKGRMPRRFGNKAMLQSSDSMLERANLVVSDLITIEKDRIKNQLCEDVMRLSNSTEEDHKRRQLCRYQFHLRHESNDGIGTVFHPIVQLFPSVFRAFCSDVDCLDKTADDMQLCDDEEYRQLLEMSPTEPGYDEMSRHVIAHHTLARLCTEECEKMDNTTALRIYNALCDFVSQSNGKLSREVMDSIMKFSECFQGLRSIRTRLSSIERFSGALDILRNHKSGMGTEALINSLKIPQSAKDSIWEEFGICTRFDHHKQTQVLNEYDKLIQSMDKDMDLKTDKWCDVCCMMSPADDFKSVRKEEIAFSLVNRCPSCTPDNVCNSCRHLSANICRVCTRNVNNGKIPPLAERNGLSIHPVPPELKKLNCIELMLIQRARVLQSVVCLRDVGNRPTGMKACGGAMVVVPTNIEGTINTVLSSLPSAAHMKISVSSNWEKNYLVCMERVLDALVWLKLNNPEYAHVALNSEFKFQVGRDIIFEDPACTQSDADKLIRRSSLQGGILFEEVPVVQPIQMVNQPGSGSLTPLKHFQLQKLPYAPFTKDDPNADIWAFAHLFPRGTGGMFSPREHKLTPSQYIRSVLLNKVRSLGTNMQLLAYHYALKMQKAISSCQGIQSRQKKNSEKFDISNPDDIKGLTAVFQKVPGFKGYWNVVKNRLKFYCAIHGPPTWFVTLNPNEREWTDLHQHYTELLGTPATKDNIRELIEKDPAVFSRYWQKRVKSILKNVILAENGPLGKVEHYYIRTEYQHRGTQHVHCLFWCKERPQNLSNPEEIRKFLDDHLTCRLPEDSESELKHLVETCQMHFPQHSATCKRLKKYRGKLYTTCRFHFPRTVRSKTAVYINEDLGDGKAGKMYELARGPNESMVNDYNPALLLAWRGNVDVQFVGANKDVINYITAYATKGEIAKKAEAIDKEGRQMTRSAAIHASGIDELNSREVGALEMVDNLLGHPAFMFDQADVWIPTDSWEHRPRMVDPKSKDPNNPFLPNLLDFYYPNRSAELENFSLYNIAVNYKVGQERPGEPILKPSATRVNNDVFSPHYRHIVPRHSIARTRSLLHLVKPRLARFFIPQYDESDASQCEDFYRRMCLLFIPWRNESEILLAYDQATYFETFLRFMDELKSTSRNSYNEIVAMVEVYQDFKKDVQRAKLKADQIQAALSTLDVEQDRDELQVQARIVNENNHDIAVRSLNDEQKMLFDMIIQGVENSLNGTKSLLLFCSGTAGVGKSYVIDRIADAIHLTYGSSQNQLSTPSVLLAAPTGLAAIAIRGLTLHSLLGLKVAKDGETTYEILSDENRDVRRVLFENVKLLIVDEASMVSSIMLATISNRLREITGKTTPFGGMNVVFFGDLLQLPPVKAQPIYEELSGYNVRKYFGGMGSGINLWNLFKFFELTKNVRQALDTEYAGILGRMRVGTLQPDDKLQLASRVIPCAGSSEVMKNAAKYHLEQSLIDPYIMTVLPRCTEVDQFNDLVIGFMGTDVISLLATENVTTSSVSTKARPWQRKEYSILHSNLPVTGSTYENLGMQSTAGGLRAELKFTLHCRVILRRTLDRVKGLVNGLTGVLEDINVVNGEVQKLGVRFDRLPDELIWVNRVTVMYTDNRRRMRSRTQFPLEPAAAVTIHKAQGLTLDNVIMKTSSIFTNSQWYVGASRVKTMAGLHLIDCDVTKVQVDQRALTEYERLRSSTL